MRFDKPSLRKPKLGQPLTEFSLYVKELCPEASIEITKTIYEDEDANIVVRPPVQWTVEACDALEASRWREHRYPPPNGIPYFDWRLRTCHRVTRSWGETPFSSLRRDMEDWPAAQAVCR